MSKCEPSKVYPAVKVALKGYRHNLYHTPSPALSCLQTSRGRWGWLIWNSTSTEMRVFSERVSQVPVVHVHTEPHTLASSRWLGGLPSYKCLINSVRTRILNLFPHRPEWAGYVHQPELKLFKFFPVQFGKEKILRNINGKFRIWKKPAIFFGKLIIFPFQKDAA